MSQQEPEWLRRAREEGLIAKEVTIKAIVFPLAHVAAPSSTDKINAAIAAGMSDRDLGDPANWPEASIDLPSGNVARSDYPFPPVREDEFQRQVIELAHLHGWRVAHFRSVPVKHGDRVVWQTPVQADGAGFVDLVLVRGKRLIFAELKTETGKASEDQVAWSVALVEAGQEYYLWRPRHWAVIEQILGAKPC